MKNRNTKSLIMGEGASLAGTLGVLAGRCVLFFITAIPSLAIVFMILFIAKESIPFFADLKHTVEFFVSKDWRPSADSPNFGALTIFYGTAMITIGSCIIAIPVGILSAVCLNEIVGARTANIVKPAVELLAAVPSIVYGFFAIVIFAPILQNWGGAFISFLILLAGIPASIIAGLFLGEIFSEKFILWKGKFYKRIVIGTAIGTLSTLTLISSLLRSTYEDREWNKRL